MDDRRVDLVPLCPPCGFGSLPCKNDGNDSQSASQATIKINGWFAERFDILGWTAAVLQGAGEHFAVLHCHPIKQAASPTCTSCPGNRLQACPLDPGGHSWFPVQHRPDPSKVESGGSQGLSIPSPTTASAPGWISQSQGTLILRGPRNSFLMSFGLWNACRLRVERDWPALGGAPSEQPGFPGICCTAHLFTAGTMSGPEAGCGEA